MKALITGANGFTGSHLIKVLQKQGHTVKGLVRKSSNLARLADSNLELVYGDITDSVALKTAMRDVDTVFHTAAYVELGLVNETEMTRVNVGGTLAVLEAAKEANIKKLVYCSTIGVLGHTFGQVVDERFERQQKDFCSAYDRTKYEAQQLVDEYAKKGLPVVSILPSGIMGPDDPHFGPIKDLFLARKLKFWVGGDRLTGIVHVDDLAQAMILVAEKGQVGEHYIISAGELTTAEMLRILGQEKEIPQPIEVPEFLVRIAGYGLDIIGKLFNWNPPLSSERVYYLYDRCVRVNATKAQQELGWKPRPVVDILRELDHELR